MEQENQNATPPITEAPKVETPSAPAATKRATTKPPAGNTPAASPAAPVARVAPLVRNRHDVAFRHDVFRSDNKEALRDVSYKHMQPDLQKIAHAHVYHSHSNSGKKNTKTGSACGHWHNVEHYDDPVTGQITAKCGPAMHEVQVQIEDTNEFFTKVEPVSFIKIDRSGGENTGKKIRIMDDHTHVLEYLGSEDLSPSKIKNDLESQRAEAAAMGVAVGGVTDNTPKPMSAADGASIS